MSQEKITTTSTNIIYLFVYLLALLILLLVVNAAHASDSKIAIVNARVIDGWGGEPLKNRVILISGNKIEAIGKNISVPDDATIIDAGVRSVMPGLADMHVHLAWGGTGEGFDLLGYQSRLNALLYAGVTAVYDMGSMLPFVQQIRQSIESGEILGPTIYYVGPLIDGVDPNWPEVSLSMVSKDQALRIANYLKSSGASAIKAYGNLSRPQVHALVRAENAINMPVIVDAWVRNGAEHMITAGMHAFAHTPGRLTEQTLAVMKERNISIITTRAVGELDKRVRLKGAEFLKHDLIVNTVPPWVLNDMQKQANRELSEQEEADIQGLMNNFYHIIQANIKRLFDKGILLVAGTDNSGLFTGEELHFELELLVDAGLTPLQAITTATKNAATLVNQSEQWGTLEPGKRADILIINGNPDKNISDSRNIEVLIKSGQIIDRKALIFDSNKQPNSRDTHSARLISSRTHN